MTQTDLQKIHVGELTVNITIRDGHRVVHAPLFYQDEIVQEQGEWMFPLSMTVEDAVTEAYLSAFPAWCDRKEQERKAQKANEPRRIRRTWGGMHTPCPALWAGR